MSNIEKIHQEIEWLRREIDDHNYYLDNSEQALGYSAALDDIEKFLNTLEDENNPEPYNPVYDEDYINEKIAKATKSWEGVDVDKYMDEVRGREHVSEDLEKAAEESWIDYEYRDSGHLYSSVYKDAFIAGAEWQKSQMLKDAVDLDADIEKELRLHYNDDQDVYWWNYLKNSFYHFYELGLNARKED